MKMYDQLRTKAEVVVADWLLVNGKESKCVNVKRAGDFHRLVSGEVAELEEDKDGILNLILRQKGLADALPESFFGAESGKNKESARLFFSPLDDALFQYGIRNELSSRNRRGESGEVPDWVASFFPELAAFATRQQKVIQRWLPRFHVIAGQVDQVERFLSELFELNCKVYWQSDKYDICTKGLNNGLGEFILGVDQVLGSQTPRLNSLALISLGALSTEQLTGFLPGAENERRLAVVLKYLLPFGVDCCLDVNPEQATTFELNTNSNLGYVNL